MRRKERFLFFRNIITIEKSQEVVKREFYIKESQEIETEPEILIGKAKQIGFKNTEYFLRVFFSKFFY